MTEASAPAADAKPAVVLDEFGEQAKARLASKITEYNALVTQYKASQGTEIDLLESLRETYTDGGEVDKVTAQIEKLDKALDDAIRHKDELLKPVVAKMISERTNEGVDTITEQMSQLLSTIKAGEKYLNGTYGEGAAEGLPALSRRTTGGGSGSGGTGNKRVRGFEFFIDGTRAEQKDSQGQVRSNLSAAARKLEVEPKVMQDAFWQAQGTQDSKNFKDTVEFQVTVKDTVYNVLAKKVAEEE